MSEIIVTDSAAKRLTSQIKNSDKAIGLRFIVKSSGCSGHSYFMELAEKIEEGETSFDSNGVNLVTNQESLDLISGTQIDYVQEGLNQSFKFSNPKAEAHCGCGESFAISS